MLSIDLHMIRPQDPTKKVLLETNFPEIIEEEANDVLYPKSSARQISSSPQKKGEHSKLLTKMENGVA